jgi:hypothetical protein
MQDWQSKTDTIDQQARYSVHVMRFAVIDRPLHPPHTVVVTPIVGAAASDEGAWLAALIIEDPSERSAAENVVKPPGHAVRKPFVAT